MKTRMIALGIGIVAIITLGVWAAAIPGGDQEIGSYMTTLRGRTDSQVYNARLAMTRINGTVLQPGETFSFLKIVGPWTADMGYKKAPVSYDGELVKSWGGGVCQVSTTLYNAALLSGLDIVERHHHHWPARYAPLGRDAAVAYEDIDMKFRNNLPEPIRIMGRFEGKNMVFTVRSTYQPKYKVRIESEMRSVSMPNDVIQGSTPDGNGRWKVVNRGHPGFCVATYRRFITPTGDRRQFLATDRYPSMNRVVRIAER